MTKTILVVDDEPEVALLLSDALEAEGHTVDVASNGAEALERLALRAYDVVVTDTKMPVLDGEAFYREVERRFPAATRPRIIFVTGDVLAPGTQEFLESTGAPVVAKPFDLDHIQHLVTASPEEPG